MKYIWFFWELEEYECSACAPEEVLYERPTVSPSQVDNFRLKVAFQVHFQTLSTWAPAGDLVLDISVHSPSDSKHWFA